MHGHLRRESIEGLCHIVDSARSLSTSKIDTIKDGTNFKKLEIPSCFSMFSFKKQWYFFNLFVIVAISTKYLKNKLFYVLIGGFVVIKALTPDICYAKEDIRRCFVGAGKMYEIDPILLYSIARIESNFNARATHKNKNGSKDVGIMQINSSWLPELKNIGINERRLFKPCLNIYVGAFILARAIKENGNNWRAVGAYNAGRAVGERHERNRIKYAKNIYNYYSAVKLQLSTKQEQFKGKRIANNNG